MRIFRSRKLMTVAALTAALTVLMALPAPAAGPGKTYTAVVTPPSAFVGSSTSFTAVVTNKASKQPLGSANITPPAGFVITLLSPYVGPGTATLSAGVIQLRNLGLAFNASATVTFDAGVSCTATAGSWSVVAKKSSDFSSSSSDPTLDAANSTLSVGVAGQCHLELGAQPSNAQVDTTITGQAYTPGGPPVTVRVLSGNNALIATSTAPVTLAIGPGSPPGVFSPDTTFPVNASGGIAAFGTLKIINAGIGFNFVATTTEAGIAGATSSSFNIDDWGVTCAPETTCSSPDITKGNTTAQLSVGAGASQASLSLDVEGLDCSAYTEVSSVITFNSTGGGLKTITIEIPKSVAGSFKKRDICYSSPFGFVDKFGNPRAPDEPGLLPSCNSTEQAPCVVSKASVDETVVIVFVAPAGDPRGRT